MADRQIIFVVARALDGTIAKDGDVPWKISDDLKRFKRLTMGKPMVMGRKTFDSLPGLLPGRRHIVLTRQPDWSAPGAEVAHTLEEAMELCGNEHIAVIGGAEIFALFMPLATKLEITEVDEHTGGDVLMDAPGPEWVITRREDRPAADGRPAYAYLTYERAAGDTRERSG